MRLRPAGDGPNDNRQASRLAVAGFRVLNPSAVEATPTGGQTAEWRLRALVKTANVA